MTASSQRPSSAELVLALAVPFVFLHRNYQPSVAVGPVDAYLTDFAILAAVAAAFVSGLREGFAPLRGYASLWAPLLAFLALILASIAWARHLDPAYGLTSHLVSAAKFLEYATLAGAAPLALRREVDRRVFLWAVLAWSAFLTLIAALQFLGVLNQFTGHKPIEREPSYIGIHDLAAFSGAAFSMGIASILLAMRRRPGIWGGVTGGLGIAIAAALDSVGGMVAAATAAYALARRRGPVTLKRALSVVAIVAVVGLGAVSLRGYAIKAFLRFLGVTAPKHQEKNIETYAQRTVLMYIGFEIWIHHPLLGVGWQESELPHAFEPYLARAHARFPNAAPESFPGPDRLWGVQNGIVQTLSDLGIVGGVLLLLVFVAAGRLVWRVATRGPPELAWGGLVGAGWLLFSLAVFTGSGLLAGLTVDSQLWLSIGLVVSLHNSLAPRG